MVGIFVKLIIPGTHESPPELKIGSGDIFCLPVLCLSHQAPWPSSRTCRGDGPNGPAGGRPKIPKSCFLCSCLFRFFFSIKINLHSYLLKERKCFPLETRSVSFEGSGSSKHRFQAEEFLVSLERHERHEHTISVCLGVTFDVSRNTVSGVTHESVLLSGVYFGVICFRFVVSSLLQPLVQGLMIET